MDFVAVRTVLGIQRYRAGGCQIGDVVHIIVENGIVIRVGMPTGEVITIGGHEGALFELHRSVVVNHLLRLHLAGTLAGVKEDGVFIRRPLGVEGEVGGDAGQNLLVLVVCFVVYARFQPPTGEGVAFTGVGVFR